MRPTTLAGTASTTRSTSSSAPPAWTQTTPSLHATRCTALASLTAAPSSAARASAMPGLPPATLGAISSLRAASPASADASTRSAVAALETSRRAWIASRAPGSSDSPSRSASAEMPARLGSRRRSAARILLSRRAAWRRRRFHLAAHGRRSASPVHRPSPSCSTKPRIVSLLGEDELGAHLDDGTVVELARPDPAADAVACFEHDDIDTLPGQQLGGSQAGKARADDGDAEAHEGLAACPGALEPVPLRVRQRPGAPRLRVRATRTALLPLPRRRHGCGSPRAGSRSSEVPTRSTAQRTTTSSSSWVSSRRKSIATRART